MKRFCTGILLSLFFVGSAFSQYYVTKTTTLNPPLKSAARIIDDEGTSYTYSTGTGNLGKESGENIVYRSYIEFNLFFSDIPDIAEIEEVTVVYYMYSDTDDHSFRLTKLPDAETGPGDLWVSVDDGSKLEETLPYMTGGNDSKVSTSIRDELDNLVDESGTLYVGVMSNNEGSNNSKVVNLSISLEVEYTYDAELNLTAMNDFDGQYNGGEIGVGVNSGPMTREDSPYYFNDRLIKEGDRIDFKAYDNQDWDGKTYFFNDTEYGEYSSWWDKERPGGAPTRESDYQAYTTDPLTLEDDGATFTAHLVTTDYTTSGAITSDETWFTPNTLTGDVGIASGATLTVLGTTVEAPSGVQINVSGTQNSVAKLNAFDATFRASSSSWGGIRFNEYSDGLIEDCEISDASNSAVSIYDASPEIDGCTIDGSNTGIFVSGSNANPRIEYNDITMDGGGSVYFTNYGSNSYFVGNELRAPDGWGAITVFNGAVLSGVRYNYLVDGYYQLYVNNSSTANLHNNYWCEPNGYTTANIYAADYSTVDADHNYFPDNNPQVLYYNSTVDYSYYGSSNYVCGTLGKRALNEEGDATETSDSESVTESADLNKGWKAFNERKFHEALQIFKGVLASSKNKTASTQAIQGLAHAFTNTKDQTAQKILLRLAEKPGPLQPAALMAMVHVYRVLGNKDAALRTATNLYKKFPETTQANFGRKAALYLLWEMGRNEEAANLLNTIEVENEWEIVELAGNIFFLVGIRGKRERFLNCPLVTFEWENSITKFRRNLMTKISQDES
ncbi:MAG: right-handed parallel beta-helix repeat-containing protein, partial [Candidatus Marinimicrobia bacterium]|nr:right-handed parallel beta-helix repeat-containing protein [Candidatus Neomarinimicrobiota bacterium]MCF7829548.1 right-handed parallel beta-helix repeat-containing protein [Candidatus Neomarinimicrobiota bacterium]MCF7881998.1 right-handed parallel beta-helix repeat-containing protein [Candidatus Neomarinimicrobiota bacterium]